MKKLVFLLTGILVSLLIHAQQRPDPQPAPDTFEKFKVGMAGYTFVKFDLDKTLEIMQKCDVRYLCIKDFHLPMNSTNEQIAAFHAKLKAKNVTGYAVGHGSGDVFAVGVFLWAGLAGLVGVRFLHRKTVGPARSQRRRLVVQVFLEHGVTTRLVASLR